MRCECTHTGREQQARTAIYYSICQESVVLSNVAFQADMAWEMIAVIIFQGLGARESTGLLREPRQR